MKWLSNYRNVNESEQLFNREFQQLTPLYFGEDKQEEISLYFMDKTTVEEAAYAVSKSGLQRQYLKINQLIKVNLFLMDI